MEAICAIDASEAAEAASVALLLPPPLRRLPLLRDEDSPPPLRECDGVDESLFPLSRTEEEE